MFSIGFRSGEFDNFNFICLKPFFIFAACFGALSSSRKWDSTRSFDVHVMYIIEDILNVPHSIKPKWSSAKFLDAWTKLLLRERISVEKMQRAITESAINPFEIILIILKYIYVGIVNVENVDIKTIYELMIAAKESHLIETKASWLRTHFINQFLKLTSLKIWKNFHPNLIFGSEDFVSLPKSALVSILKRDDLKWSDDNFLTLKITLQQCLPHIQHALEISSWIDFKSTPYLPQDMPHRFQLILRGSRDGFAPKTFWDMCHGYANTIAI
ncbi:hypothetical protein Glove_40g170 [Diversispora epigaea]|uniref:BTB domain-containing protein n=1 Tax=Diversispora epigaea TaxID=1348612 RepID=A0A397JMF0_9GLOM|nr:hypothetical protein Glove_40g170 [Diversispora epigaea]